MGVQNQIYAHKIKLVGGTKRVVEKSRILVVYNNYFYSLHIYLTRANRHKLSALINYHNVY